MTATAEDRSDPEPVHLLLVEDDPDDVRRIEAHLDESGAPCDLVHVDTLERALAAIAEEPFDLCLLDVSLPDSADVETDDRLWSRVRDLPLVVMSGLDELDRAMAALQAGAAEYLVKDGMTPGVLGRLLRTVLERDQARRERRRIQEKWTSIFEASPVAIVLSDADSGRLIEVNDAFVEMFGPSREELLGASSLELGHWDDPDRRRELVDRVKEHGSFEGEEATFRDAEGRRGRMLLSCRRLELADGDWLLWTVQDITEHVEREQALAERVKEQSCLYEVTRLLHEGERPLGERLQAVVDRIPAGWQYPEVTAAKIEVGERRYVSAGFEEVDPRLAADLEVEGERIGELVVGYREERPEEDLGPFLIEERHLLEELANQIETELSRRQIRRRMRHVVETMTEAVTIVAPDGTITFANSAARRLYGDSDAGYVGEDLTDFAPRTKTLDGASHPPEELPFQTVLRTGDPVTGFEHLIERTDGERIAVSVNAAPIADEEGKIQGVVLSARDVTEQHRAAEWRHLLQTSVEAAGHGILITDREGEIVWANPAFTEMTGYSLGELEGETPRILQSGEQDEAFYEKLWETILAGETWEGEIVNRREDGTLYAERQSIVPVRHRSDEITHFIAMKEDITEEKRREAKLEHQALHDPLTGLANRTLFEDRLQQALARSRRSGEPMGLLMVDLDRFKRINEHLGHSAGDKVLDRVARRLATTVREADTVARWGGDEFVVVLPELDGPAVIESVQHRLREAVRVPIQAGGEKLEIGLTIGGVVQSDADVPRTVGTNNPEDLVRFADLALRRGKRQSPGGFYLFDPTDDLDEVPALRLEQELRRGLRAGEIEVFYQPIYRLADQKLWGFEALARWHHPERGLVPPGAFIPLAERVGLIHELGDEVFRQGCRQLAAWIRDREGGGDLTLAINLSAHEFQAPGLNDRMAKGLEEVALSLDRVVVEVTETAMMSSMDQARALQAMGITLCIDDFGTGYSTFTYLRELKPDGLKIDMSLVQGLHESTTDVAIVDSLVTLANRLDLVIVAEGIETEAQLRMLRDLGADLGQGFLLGRPAPADEIDGLLDRELSLSGGE